MYWMTVLCQWLIVIPFSRSQYVFSRSDEPPYGDCERFELSDLGPFGGPDPSVPSILFDVLYNDPNRASYEVYLDEAVFTCWAPSFRRGYYSSVAFIAKFHCDGGACGIMGERVRHLYFVCNPNGNFWSHQRNNDPEAPYRSRVIDLAESLNTTLSVAPEIEVCGACLLPEFGWAMIAQGNIYPVTACVGCACNDQCVGPFQEATACCIGYAFDENRGDYYCISECNSALSQDVIFDEQSICRRQVCSEIYDVTRNLQQILVNTSGIPCVQCLLSNGQVFSKVVFVIVLTQQSIAIGSPAPDFLVNDDGMLMIFNASMRLSVGTTILIDCETEMQRYQQVRLTSTIIAPLSLSVTSLALHEGDSGSSICLDVNLRNLVSNEATWIFPMGVPDGVQVEYSLIVFNNARRHHAGEYVCTAGYVTGESSSAVLTVVVEYGPEASTPESDLHVSYGDDLIVPCEYEGVPTPAMVWIKDGMELSMDDRTSINTIFNDRGGVSTLTIVESEIEDGGLYTCRATSTLGIFDATFTLLVYTDGAPSTHGSIMMCITCAALCLGQFIMLSNSSL